MKKSLALSIFLLAFINGGVFAQSQNPITWAMAVNKWVGSEYQDFSPLLPINMKSGDEYYIYIKSDSPGYCYVIQQDPNEALSVLFAGPFTVGEPLLIMEDVKNGMDFTVPAGTGNLRYYVVVSSTPRPNLGTGQNLTGAQRTAVNREILAIRNSLSSITEARERQVVIAAGVRGESTTVYQYEGQDTYVRTVNINY